MRATGVTVLTDVGLARSTFLGLCSAAFVAWSEGLGPDDAAEAWLESCALRFGYDPEGRWPAWVVAHFASEQGS